MGTITKHENKVITNKFPGGDTGGGVGGGSNGGDGGDTD